MLLKIEKWIDSFSDVIGYITAGLMFLTMINVFYDAIMRYFFNTGSIALQETEWHMFSIVFLLGISYTLKEDSHVRVDLVYDRLSQKARGAINILGTLFFLIPLAVLIIYGSLPFVEEAYITNEISGDPGGLTHRWLIKGVIPLAFVSLLITALGFVLRNYRVFRGDVKLKERNPSDDII
ncbi:MAG: TRAP transporter small permease subunit [Magnetococcales bacterium]|nr:TRAP transporter small permease subunit [Magnetococcales bacterium]